MLNVYLKSCDVDVVFFNDDYFDSNREEYSFGVDTQNLMQQIDGVSYISPLKMISKFEDYAITTEYLSTGCKTAINILENPQNCFYVGSCGKNALQEILKFKIGNIFVNEFFVPLDFINDIRVYVGNESKIIKNHKDFLLFLGEVFE